MDINAIEKELSQLLSSDKKSWVRIYELMEEVEQKSLYESEYRSYTAWVNTLAERTKVHVSVLWARKKAGKVYADYANRMAQRGTEVPLMESLSISPDNLVLVDKIARNNVSVANELVTKVVAGDLKRSDLKNAWAMVKRERSERGESATLRNGYDRKKVMNEQPQKESCVTAADIILALGGSHDEWLEQYQTYSKYKDFNYKLFTEFAVQTGTSKSARRIDALVAESYSTKDNYSIALHGVEIKISKGDLEHDHKMQEYYDYCDYFWIAIPESLIDIAKDLIIDGWGILVFDNEGYMKPVVPAKRHDAIMRDITMATIINKLI